MSYIIDNINLLKNDGIEKMSILINENRIEFMRHSLENYHYMRMDMSSFLLTPGYIMLDFSLHLARDFKEFKEHFIRDYLKKGCTSLLTVVDIQFERELAMELRKRRQLMINSPIDYYVGVKLPLDSLTPSILRKCRQQNVSVVFVEINSDDKLNKKSWGWIRDAMFANPLTLIPYLSKDIELQSKRQKLIQKWTKIMKEQRISSLLTIIDENSPIKKDVMMKLGIYPEKGDIRVGGQVDYNIYLADRLLYYPEGFPIINYNEHYPIFTAHKGRLINVNGKLTFNPGIGQECFIPISGRFIPQSASF